LKFNRLPDELRGIVLQAYLPTLIFSIGEGAILPIVPASAVRMGASLAVSGLIAGAALIGQLVGDVPSGQLVSRLGERRAMVAAACLSVAAILCCVVARNYVVLGVGIFFLGISSSTFALARHAFLAVSVPYRYRARALSTLGGFNRAGNFVGPTVAVAVIHFFGVENVFFVHLACCAAVVVLLFALPDIKTDIEQPRIALAIPVESQSLLSTIKRLREVLARLGVAVLLMSAIRASRTALLPLWAVHMGLSPSTTALIVGTAAAAEFVLFYSSGVIMDRFGRAWSAVPCLLGLTLGHLMLIFVNGAAGLLTVGLVLGLSNGVGSGIQMTLGADIAPPDNPAAALGAWRFLGDLGSATAPLVISLLISVASSLPLATGAISVCGLIGAGLMARYIPRYVPVRPAPVAVEGTP
jgi:MFS family permease